MMSFPTSDEKFAALLKEKAEANDPEFQFQVGRCYRQGNSVEVNNAEAMKWYKLAAEQGHAGAQFYLGHAFDIALGVEENVEEALKWYNLSAEQGHAYAQNNLAVSYEHGRGVVQNLSEALRLFTLSAEQHNWRAAFNLGQIYSSGKDVEQNLAKAKKYFEQALVDTDFSGADATKTDRKRLEEKIADLSTQLEEIESKVTAARKAERTEVFISYAHKDIDYKEELLPHLKMLKNTTNIIWWDDSNLKSGENWNEKIKEALSKAKVAVLMVSANFFASDYIWRTELPAMLEAADQDGATILWVPVSACLFDGTGIENFQSIITDLKNPLDKRATPERHEVYTEVVRRIRELFKVQ